MRQSQRQASDYRCDHLDWDILLNDNLLHKKLTLFGGQAQD